MYTSFKCLYAKYSSPSYKLCKSYSLLEKENLISLSSIITKKHLSQKSKLDNTDPTLATKIVSLLKPRNEGIYLDMTFGDGHHTCKLLDDHPNVKVIALDRDINAYRLAVKLKKEKYSTRLLPLYGRISDLQSLLNGLDERTYSFVDKLDGVLLDPGVSTLQLMDVKRGFNLSENGPLDLRMEPEQEATVSDVLKYVDSESLFRIFKYYGGEKQARKLSQAFVDSRSQLEKMTTTTDVKKLVQKILGKLYPSTCVLQGLRMFINNELNELNYGINLAHHFLKPSGALLLLSHNPQEDMIMSNHLSGKNILSQNDPTETIKPTTSILEEFSADDIKKIVSNKWNLLTKSAMVPSLEEQDLNPLLKLVRIRVAYKVTNV